MTYPFGRTVYRLRAKTIPDPYNPEEQIPGDWSDPDVLDIPGAFIAQASTSLLGDPTRSQASEAKSLFCAGTFDVQKGDRVRNGPEGSAVYTIDGLPPDADTHPWTGWTPEREIPLTRYVG